MGVEYPENHGRIVVPGPHPVKEKTRAPSPRFGPPRTGRPRAPLPRPPAGGHIGGSRFPARRVPSPGGPFFVDGPMINEMREKLGREIEALSRELTVTLPQAIATAVEMGDLRENSEYKAALERQQLVQARLGQLHSA